MKTGDVVGFMLQHLVAALVSFALFIGGSVLLVILAMIIGNDPGGPMFFPDWWLLSASGIVSVTFSVHWATLCAAGGILSFIRSKWT
jgi:hypothetical protein